MKNGEKIKKLFVLFQWFKIIEIKTDFWCFFFFKNIHFVQIYVFSEFLNMLSPFNVKSGIFWKMSFLEKIIFGKNHDFFQWFISDINRIFINDIYQLINIMPTLAVLDLHIGICHQGCALSPLFLIVIITFRDCFLDYLALLFAQNNPRNYRFSHLLVSSIIFHSYKLWQRKLMRNFTYEEHAMLRTNMQSYAGNIF